MVELGSDGVDVREVAPVLGSLVGIDALGRNEQGNIVGSKHIIFTQFGRRRSQTGYLRQAKHTTETACPYLRHRRGESQRGEAHAVVEGIGRQHRQALRNDEVAGQVVEVIEGIAAQVIQALR